MAKSKADMLADWIAYHEQLREAHRLIAEQDYDNALNAAAGSLEFLDGMMGYAMKYENVAFESISAIDFLLGYAPLRFRHDIFDRIEETLKSQRRIQRRTSTNLTDAVAESRERMRQAHLLWTILEDSQSDASAHHRLVDVVDRRRVAGILKDWHSMHIVETAKTPIGYRLTTWMEEPHSAKCGHCGVVARAPKRKFLDALKCPKCSAETRFVFLSPARNR